MGKPKNFVHSQFNHMSLWRGSIDDIVTCPYDPSHVLKYGRLQLHIIKCKKVFEKKNPELAKTFVTCDYSTLHRFPKDKLEEHLTECKEYMMTIHARAVVGKELTVQRRDPELNAGDTGMDNEDDLGPEYLQEWI